MKKLLSIILVAAMILSLIPSVFAEGGTEPATYVYNFDVDYVKDVKKDPRYMKGIADEAYFAKYATEYKADSSIDTTQWTTENADNWKFFAMSEGLKKIYNAAKDAATPALYTIAGIGGDGLQMNVSGTNYNNNVVEGPQWLAIKIRVPETGVYNLSYQKVTKNGYCSDAFISILPGEYAPDELTYEICRKNGFVSDISYHVKANTSAVIEKPITIDNVLVVTENNQEFLFVMGNNGVKGYNVVNNITLTKAGESVDENTYTTDTVTGLNPQVVAYLYTDSGKTSVNTTAEDDDGDGIWNISTDETIDGYTFRYWARGLENAEKGNKRIVSLEENFEYSPEKGETNYLIAVYTKDGEEAETEYFNANGQLLPGAKETDRPYMLGYGEATGWKDNGNGIKEAVYGEGVHKYDITVNGVPGSYEYGAKITCPEVEEPEGKYFWGWTKTAEGSEKAELVSTDMNYIFYAWEACTVEPLFKDSKAVFGSDLHKIILSSLDIGNNESVIKAEFIGFEDAVERGITLGSKDYAMTRADATQFAIINNVNATEISAYAILADGMKYIYSLDN